jgi:hypothetical protein
LNFIFFFINFIFLIFFFLLFFLKRFQSNFEIFLQKVSEEKDYVDNVKEKVEKLILTSDSKYNNIKTNDLENSLRTLQDEKSKLLQRLKEIGEEEKRLFLEISFRKQHLNEMRNYQIGKKK